MAQNDINSLILAAMDENNHLKQSRILLEIAVEQLAFKDSSKTFERIEVLLDEYISSYNHHFDELTHILYKLRKATLTITRDNISA